MKKQSKNKTTNLKTNTLVHAKLFGAFLLLTIFFGFILYQALGYRIINDFETGVLITKVIFWFSALSLLVAIVMAFLLLIDFIKWFVSDKKKSKS